MPNKIQYKTSTPSGSLRKGNMAIGVDPNVALGPTSTTGFYAGITPPSGGYTIYQNKASQGPSIYVVNNDVDLLDYVNDQVAGTIASPAGYTTANQCLNYFVTQSDKLCVNFDYEGIVTNGLLINVDAGFTPSYPKNGTSIYDLGGGAVDGTLTNGPTFNSSNSGSIVFDGVDDYINFGTSYTSLDLISKSFCAWVYLGATLANPTGIMDKQFDNGGANYGGWGFWVGSNRKLWWWNQANLDIIDNGPTTIGTNVWTHIAVTYNSSTKTASFYINGTLNSSGSNAGIVEKSSGATNLTISGIRNASQGIINGRVANVFAYNRVLSATEILQNYNAQKGRFGL